MGGRMRRREHFVIALCMWCRAIILLRPKSEQCTMLQIPIAPVSDSSAARIEGGRPKEVVKKTVHGMEFSIAENVCTSSDIVLVTSTVHSRGTLLWVLTRYPIFSNILGTAHPVPNTL